MKFRLPKLSWSGSERQLEHYLKASKASENPHGRGFILKGQKPMSWMNDDGRTEILIPPGTKYNSPVGTRRLAKDLNKYFYGYGEDE